MPITPQPAFTRQSSAPYWQTPRACGFQAKTAQEWQRHGIVYQSCGQGTAPFQPQRGKRKPNV